MRSHTFRFGDGIFAYRWLPDDDDPIAGAVQIAHGMAEHAGRYEAFARFLTAAGFAVYANDHRGHGRTAGRPENIGYFADADGWRAVVEDMKALTAVIHSEWPDRPPFLLGHSMGSLLARTYIADGADNIAGLILSATSGDPGVLGTVGRLIARWECWRKGKKTPSPLLNTLSFGGFNKAFAPARTDFDWLSRDTDQVDAYVADPYCGGVFTAGFFCDLLDGLAFIGGPAALHRVRKDLPVLLASGDRDPVGKDTRGVREVARAMSVAGITDLTTRFYAGARHEILNETNRDEVYRDLLDWMREKTAA